MSPRTGRPKADNPMSERITIRIDKETSTFLNEFCERNKIDKAEAVRLGINMLRESEK